MISAGNGPGVVYAQAFGEGLVSGAGLTRKKGTRSGLPDAWFMAVSVRRTWETVKVYGLWEFTVG